MPELKVKFIAKPAPKEKGKEKSAQYSFDKRSLKVFLGNKKDLTEENLRQKISDLDWRSFGEERILLDTPGFSSREQEIIYEMVRLKNYNFQKYKTVQNGKKRKLKEESPLKIRFKQTKSRKAISERSKINDAVEFCRNIVSSNASEINPGGMEELARKISRARGLSMKLVNAKQAERLGMGCLLAVGAESMVNNTKDFHPRLVVLEYTPPKSVINKLKKEKKKLPNIALVGKGITFDTGGLCLKPTNYMLDMKTDMGGSAAVLSVFKAIADMKLTLNCKVTGVLALAENGFGGGSYKPGDVLKAMNGKTVQVVDTDAEGRLALADALSYVSEKVKPDQIMDFATLTGSIVAALGEVAAGVMTNDDQLLHRVKKHFEHEGERIWEMPIFDEYKVNIKSPIADLAHCNGRPDASVAALFLKEFVGNKKFGKEEKQIPWLHFDIAGSAFLERDGLWAYKGATGFPVKSLISYLRSL